MTPPLITLEEHFYSKSVFESLDERGAKIFRDNPDFVKLLRDVEEHRLQSMDNNGVALQVISHSWQTGGGSIDACRAGNDELAARIRAHASRFAAFAVLPIADPEKSAQELERTVRQLKFVGALIDNHTDGGYYDGSEYECLWKKATELDVPIYIHPSLPSEEMVRMQFEGNYSAETTRSLGLESWGWHSDTGLQILRLYAAGVFDRHPNLKIIIGHMGEMLPFMLERCSDFSRRWDQRQRPLTEVWQENIWVTTSGVWSLNPLRCLLGNTKIDHIMYSVDYPFTSNERGKQWFESLEQSGLLTAEELEMIAHKNAERLLKVAVTHGETGGSVVSSS